MPLPPLLLAAHGDRGQRWSAVLKRSHDIELLAVIDLAAGGVEGFEEALDARPDAAVACWAYGPIEATRLAERLVEHRGPSLLHPAPARPPLGSDLQIAHGWLSLSGIGALERLFASRSVESVRLTVRGAPEGPARGLELALYHAATVFGRLGADLRVERATLSSEDELELTLSVDDVPWRVAVSGRGHGLELIVRTREGDYAWSADAVSETLRRPRAEPRVIPAAPWEERSLRQVAAPLTGADLGDARAARALIDAVEVTLERRLPPRRRSRRDDDGGLLALGLLGEPPDAAPLAPSPPPRPPAPFEALAYALELRPAVVRTVDPADEDVVRAALPGHVVRRERLVSAGVDDPLPRRDRRGAIRAIVLSASRDREVAERLAELSDVDSPEHRTQIGALLGYPACCVQAFEAQSDRTDESYRRYAVGTRTSYGPAPWVAMLDDTALELLPHVLCTYRCERSREQARALLAAMKDEHPALRDDVLRFLGGPVLYFDHDHQLRFDGEVTEGTSIRYRAVRMPWSPSEPFARLAGAIALGDRLVLGDGALSVHRGEQRLFALERTDPGLGLLMPFAPSTAIPTTAGRGPSHPSHSA